MGDSQTAVSGQNELVLECREKCDAAYFDCNRETYILYGGIGILLLSCPATMCLTNIFDNVRAATRKEAEKLRREGLEQKEREATAPKQRERYISKRNLAKIANESKEEPDLESPDSPKKPVSDGDDLSDGEEMEEREEKKPSLCYRLCVQVVTKIYKTCFRLVSEPVLFVKAKLTRLTRGKKKPPPTQIFTDMECPSCNSAITVQGLDQVNIQEAIFSRQWGLNRCAIYCPVCNEVISGIAAF